MRASREIQILNRDVKLDDLALAIWTPVLLGLLLNELDEASETIVKLDLLLSLSLLLLELVHVSQSFAGSLVVKVICRHTSFFEELDVLDFLLSNENWHLKVEVNDDDQFIFSTGLEKGMLDVGEGDIHVVTLSGHEAHTVLVNLQVASRLLSNDVGADD